MSHSKQIMSDDVTVDVCAVKSHFPDVNMQHWIWKVDIFDQEWEMMLLIVCLYHAVLELKITIHSFVTSAKGVVYSAQKKRHTQVNRQNTSLVTDVTFTYQTLTLISSPTIYDLLHKQWCSWNLTRDHTWYYSEKVNINKHQNRTGSSWWRQTRGRSKEGELKWYIKSQYKINM